MLALLFALALAAAAPDPTDFDQALQEAARLADDGDHDGASELYRRTLELLPPRSAVRARTLMTLSDLELGVGDYAASARHAREAADIFSALQDRAAEGWAVNRVGQVATYAGDYAGASAAFQAAVRLSSAAGHREREAEQLGNLASVYFFIGRYSDASRIYERGLKVTADAAAEPWAKRRRRLLRANQAAMHVRLGRYQEALAIYREIEGAGDLHPDEEHAQLLANVGVLYRRLGDPVKALATYDKARALFAGDRHVDGELNVMKNRGIVQALDLALLPDAERTFLQALDLATRAGNRREMLHARLYRGETLRLAGQPVRARGDFLTGLALARELQTPEEEWKALYGLGRITQEPDKAREYLAAAVSVIERVRERITVPLLRSDFFNDKSEVYDALIAARIGRAPPAELFELIERRHSRAWRERLGLSGSLQLADVQRALPAGVLLLDYWSSPSGSAVVAATRTRAAVISISVDDAQVASLADALAFREGKVSDWRDLSRRIAARVLPPPKWFEGVEHIIVVADGALTLVPFELLGRRETLLIERAAVSYTPTAATLLRPAPSVRAWAPPWHLQLRAFGDPVFSSASLDELPALRTRLASSAREVRGIAAELGGTAALHLAADARKAHLLEPTHRAPILHLATHASADAAALEGSRIVFSPPGGTETSADYLFLREAYELDLAGVELAVLSACETERGRLTRGEGVQSFSRAFLAAGARSTITTLWRVADGPTADFMQVFYHHLQRGVTRDEALRRAKLRFLESGSTLAHPHYWAAFVLTGDGIRPVPRAVTWRATISSCGVLTLIAVVIAGLRARRRQARVESAAAAGIQAPRV